MSCYRGRPSVRSTQARDRLAPAARLRANSARDPVERPEATITEIVLRAAHGADRLKRGSTHTTPETRPGHGTAVDSLVPGVPARQRLQHAGYQPGDTPWPM